MAVTVGLSFGRGIRQQRVLAAGAICAVLPDADVLCFSFGIPYDHWLGHRGFFHSLLFSLLLAFAVKLLFFRSQPLNSREGLLLILYLFLCTASHAVLDAVTSGGLGVALFSPFDNSRYFFPWRPVKVSPIGASAFFSEWGVRVIKSELKWIWLPCAVWTALIFIMQWLRKKVAATN